MPKWAYVMEPLCRKILPKTSGMHNKQTGGEIKLFAGRKRTKKFDENGKFLWNWAQTFNSVKCPAEIVLSPSSQQHLKKKDIAFSINHPFPHLRI